MIIDDIGYDKCGGNDSCLVFCSELDVVGYLCGFDILN